jgi:hypothetical protein
MIPELERLSEGVQLLQRVRELFYEMSDAGERDRAWDYLRSRFAEFEKADVPSWEQIEYERLESGMVPDGNERGV